MFGLQKLLITNLSQYLKLALILHIVRFHKLIIFTSQPKELSIAKSHRSTNKFCEIFAIVFIPIDHFLFGPLTNWSVPVDSAAVFVTHKQHTCVPVWCSRDPCPEKLRNIFSCENTMKRIWYMYMTNWSSHEKFDEL